MNIVNSTIAAISTAKGNAAIAIIRISGRYAEKIADSIIKTKSGKKLQEIENYKITLGKIVKYKNSQVCIDEVLFWIARSPNSYTGENFVEINCHGGFFVTQLILDELIKAGAVLANPGEFTRRAFMNGKLDLTQAESVIQIINSESRLYLENSVKCLNGELSEKINYLKNFFISIASRISASNDFPDEIEEIDIKSLYPEIDEKKKEIEKIVDSYENGVKLEKGIKVSIIGKPNVGKSSILNAFVGFERSIVTDVEGTTRDVVEEETNVDGLIIKVYDTAGIHESLNKIEKIGIKYSIENIKSCDVVLFVLNANSFLTKEDIAIFEIINLYKKHIIFIINKIDLREPKVDILIKTFNLSIKEDVVLVSTPQNEKNIGIDELKKKIYKKVINDNINTNELYITNARQKECLNKTLDSIEKILFGIQNNISHDILCFEIEEISKSIENVLGTNIQEEIIESIFSNFCVGK
ncbi:MAG: tRNA uridine-5-carboxymethylaminomethyl(34) synthesis GTPase MnmE [Clostridiales bacterium]|jgi:tRNA modification GTPase|nr:tRNA uridine-5-carboxymethylaminomethyl(34) synthesis GTPase MnmE [Clostridiales bacterium]